jgi:hypothetical protein
MLIWKQKDIPPGTYKRSEMIENGVLIYLLENDKKVIC